MSLQTYMPELGEKKPVADYEARRWPIGNKYTVKARNEIAPGRGITFVKTYKPEDLVPQAQFRVGWHEYTMTQTAFERFCAANTVISELLLD